MPEPLAICIEYLDSESGSPCFMRCTALVGRQPGLRLDSGGDIQWQHDDEVVCELWVSADDKLILYRPEGALEVTVRRGGRSLDVPSNKPVVVIDQDEVDTCGRRMRLHVHGVAPAVSAPSAFEPSQRNAMGPVSRAATAAMLGGSVLAGAACPDTEATTPPPPPPPIDVREQPPDIMVVDPPQSPPPPPPAPPVEE